MISKFSVFVIVIIAVIGLDATCPENQNNQLVSNPATIVLTKIEPSTEAPTPV
jgi:hypothetical protein